ncbi:unnamed protein product [Calypogeia fissa]
MAFRPADVIGLIWHHPIVSLAVLLLFTPPLFPIVVYFSPLLISTALFVLAMISMESDHANDRDPYSTNVPYSKGVWIEEVEVDGPLLDGERVPKRLKASSNDESWLNKVKNLEGTGRAWVESVLSQESRKSVDDNATSRDESIPLLDKARGFFMEDVRKRSRDVEPKSSKASDGVPSVLNTKDYAPSVHAEKAGSVADLDKAESSSKAIPDLESEDELIEIAAASIPPSPLFRKRTLPKADTTANIAKKAEDSQPAEAKSNTVESAGGSVPCTNSEDGMKIAAPGSNSVQEKDGIPPVVEQKVVERPPADVENSSNGGENGTSRNESVAKEGNSVAEEEVAHSSGTEKMSEIKASNSAVDRNLAEKSQSNVMSEGDRGKSGSQPKEVKPAAELGGLVKQGQASSYGLGTPSAAVALSEKLKVPLADIMSLLAGDGNGKENVSHEGPSGVEMSSSSETTTSQEEEWSASDVESSAPRTTVRDLASSSEKAP